MVECDFAKVDVVSSILIVRSILKVLGLKPSGAGLYQISSKEIMLRTCLYCNKDISGKDYRIRYCSHSCAAIVNNKKYIKRPKLVKEKNKTSLERFYLGELHYRYTIRKILIRLFGNVCSKCDILGLWNNKPLVLTVEHKDGNAGNDSPNNLCLLCPNCHSQSPTFGGRNKGFGRKSRGLPR